MIVKSVFNHVISVVCRFCYSFPPVTLHQFNFFLDLKGMVFHSARDMFSVSSVTRGFPEFDLFVEGLF